MTRYSRIPFDQSSGFFGLKRGNHFVGVADRGLDDSVVVLVQVVECAAVGPPCFQVVPRLRWVDERGQWSKSLRAMRASARASYTRSALSSLDQAFPPLVGQDVPFRSLAGHRNPLRCEYLGIAVALASMFELVSANCRWRPMPVLSFYGGVIALW